MSTGLIKSAKVGTFIAWKSTKTSGMYERAKEWHGCFAFFRYQIKPFMKDTLSHRVLTYKALVAKCAANPDWELRLR